MFNGRTQKEKHLLTLFFLSTVTSLLMVGRAFKDATPVLSSDSAFFQHAGWYMTQGAVPYSTIWDIKPPLLYYVTYPFALLSQNDMYIYHIMLVLVSFTVVSMTILLIYEMSYNLTNQDGFASFTAALVPLSFPAYYFYFPHGIRAKQFTILFGLLSIYLFRRRRPALSGATAALSAGFWQIGAIFPISLLIVSFTGEDNVFSVVSGIVVVTIISVIPIAVFDAFVPMAAGAILAPVLAPEGAAIVSTALTYVLYLGYTSIPVFFGKVGLLSAVYYERSKDWVWLAGIEAWFIFQVMFLDFDSFPDLFPVVVFSFPGIAFLLSTLRDTTVVYKSRTVNTNGLSMLVAAAIGITIVVSVVFLGGTGLIFSQKVPPYLHNLEINEQAVYLNDLFWQTKVPESCSYRLSTDGERTQAIIRGWELLSDWMPSSSCPELTELK